MQNRLQRNWKLMLIPLTVAVVTVLIVACDDSSTSVPIDLQNMNLPNLNSQNPQIDMSETIQRLQQAAPLMQQQLNQMENLNPGLASNCSSAYPEKCIPPPPPRLTCKEVGMKNFLVLPPDPHHFDPDGNGLGCEG